MTTLSSPDADTGACFPVPLNDPSQDQASELIRLATDAAWRANPDPQTAYRCAVAAVEAVFAPVMSEHGLDSKLVTLIEDLAERPDLWDEMRIIGGSPSLVLSQLLRLLAENPPKEWIRAEEYVRDGVRDQVSIAATVVSLMQRGLLERYAELTPEEEAEDLRVAEEAIARYEAGELKTRPFHEYHKERLSQDLAE